MQPIHHPNNTKRRQQSHSMPRMAPKPLQMPRKRQDSHSTGYPAPGDRDPQPLKVERELRNRVGSEAGVPIQRQPCRTLRLRDGRITSFAEDLLKPCRRMEGEVDGQSQPKSSCQQNPNANEAKHPGNG